VRNVRNNFKNMYKHRLYCPLQCENETPLLDTQNHLLHCKKLVISNPLNLTIENVFGDIESQEQIGRLIFKILTQRNKILDEMEETEKSIPNS
jgi:hypothetical protein